MTIGSTLTVLLDHEPASRLVPLSAFEWGQEVESVREEDGVWHVTVRKRVP